MADTRTHGLKLSPAALAWAGAGLALVVAMIWLLWPRAVLVETAIIDRGDVTREIFEEARVEVRDVHAVTAPVMGRLEHIDLEPGDPVKTGQIVARIGAPAASLLDPRLSAEAQSAVNAARAAVRAAEANLDLANSERQRTAALAQSGFASPAALDRSQREFAAATAELDLRKAELIRAEAAAGRHSDSQATRAIRSPIDGIVLQVLQESEADIMLGALLMEIGDPSRMEIVGEFLSQDAARMKPGALVAITGIDDQVIAGRVRTVEPFARTKVSALGVEEQRVDVVIDFEPSAVTAGLGHGYKVDAGVQVFRAEGVLRVPTDALVRHNGGWAVFALSDGRARLREIRIGDGDDRFRVVSEGVQEGDVVILFPGDTVRDGDLVETAK